MFVVLSNLSEISNSHIYDSQLPTGNSTERSVNQFLELLSNPNGNWRIHYFSIMLREKENAQVISPEDLVSDHLGNLSTVSIKELADKRELLRDFYLQWLNNVGCDMVKEERQKASDLYWNVDELLKALHGRISSN